MASFTCSWKVILIWWSAVNPFVASPSLHEEYILKKNVAFIPRNEREFMEQTKDLKCAHSEGRKLHLTYLISPYFNETIIGCFYEIHVTVKKCLEYNEENGKIFMQPSILARCDDLTLTPCKGNYSSTKSYELFQCFEKYGGILSLMEKERRIEQLMERVTERIHETDNLTSKTNGTVCQKENAELHSCNELGVYIGNFFEILFSLFSLIILIIPACIQICRNKVKCGDFWKLWFGTLKLLYSSGNTDGIQDSLSGQVSNTDNVHSNQHDKDTQTDLSTDKLGTDDDTFENSEMTTDDLENLTIQTEDDPFI